MTVSALGFGASALAVSRAEQGALARQRANAWCRLAAGAAPPHGRVSRPARGDDGRVCALARRAPACVCRACSMMSPKTNAFKSYTRRSKRVGISSRALCACVLACAEWARVRALALGAQDGACAACPANVAARRAAAVRGRTNPMPRAIQGSM